MADFLYVQFTHLHADCLPVHSNNIRINRCPEYSVFMSLTTPMFELCLHQFSDCILRGCDAIEVKKSVQTDRNPYQRTQEPPLWKLLLQQVSPNIPNLRSGATEFGFYVRSERVMQHHETKKINCFREGLTLVEFSDLMLQHCRRPCQRGSSRRLSIKLRPIVCPAEITNWQTLAKFSIRSGYTTSGKFFS